MTGKLPEESWHHGVGQSCLGFVNAQCVEQPIKTLQYLICATGDGSCALRLLSAAPLLLQDLICPNEDHDNDILAWLLANDGRHPVDLMFLESRPDLRADGTPTPEPAYGRYRYLNCNIRDRSGQAGDNLGIQEEDDDDDDDDYNQDGGGRGSEEKSSWDNVEPDDKGKSDEDDESDKSDKSDMDDEMERVSRMAEKESAARIDNVSSKL